MRESIELTPDDSMMLDELSKRLGLPKAECIRRAFGMLLLGTILVQDPDADTTGMVYEREVDPDAS